MNEYEDCKFSRNDKIDFVNSEFIGCDFRGYQFDVNDLNKAKFIECKFIECNLSNCLTSFSTFRDVCFEDCKMIGINWSDSQTVTHVVFRKCLLDYNIFHNMKIVTTVFYDCSLREADFSQSRLVGAEFNKSELLNVNFSGCDLSKADFRQSKNFFIDPAYTNIKKAIFSMPEAMNLLIALDVVVKD